MGDRGGNVNQNWCRKPRESPSARPCSCRWREPGHDGGLVIAANAGSSGHRSRCRKREFYYAAVRKENCSVQKLPFAVEFDREVISTRGGFIEPQPLWGTQAFQQGKGMLSRKARPHYS